MERMCIALRTRVLLLGITILAGMLSGWALIWRGVPVLASIPIWARLLFLAACIGIAVLEWKGRFIWALAGLFFAVVISVLYVFD